MSHSLHVVGFKPPDAKWKKMKAAYDACVKAEIDPPKEVREFFGYDRPDDVGVTIELEEEDCCKEYNAEMVNGFEIDVKKLPKDVTIIRFYVAY